MRARDFAQTAPCLTVTNDSSAIDVSRRTTDSNALQLGASATAMPLKLEVYDAERVEFRPNLAYRAAVSAL
jgi:hypothetical protein